MMRESGKARRTGDAGDGAGGGEDAAAVERVLKARAHRLAEPRSTGGSGAADGLAALCCRVGGETYAVPLDDLAEVMPLAGWTPVPGMPQHLLGVTNVRGEICPVLDLHAMLGLPRPEAGRGHVVFLKAGGGRQVGLRVDALDRMVFIDPAALTRPQEAANGLPERYVAGITPDTLVLLDVRQILALDILQDRPSDNRRAM